MPIMTTLLSGLNSTALKVHRCAPPTFKGPGIFVIPLPVCSTCTPHAASPQLADHGTRRSPTRSTPASLDLPSLWGEEAVQSQLHTSCKNFNTYGPTASEKGRERDTQQYRAKIQELRQAYQKARQANHGSGAALKTYCFYKELHTILGGDPTSTAKSPMDTLDGLEAAASKLNPGEEVVDEEVEHTAGSPGGALS